jgi:hypothetical protein
MELIKLIKCLKHAQATWFLSRKKNTNLAGHNQRQFGKSSRDSEDNY